MIFHSIGISVQLLKMRIQWCWFCQMNSLPGKPNKTFVSADSWQSEFSRHMAMRNTKIEHLKCSLMKVKHRRKGLLVVMQDQISNKAVQLPPLDLDSFKTTIQWLMARYIAHYLLTRCSRITVSFCSRWKTRLQFTLKQQVIHKRKMLFLHYP